MLQNLKILSIPTWLKTTVLLLLAGLGAVNASLFAAGVLSEQREGWVKASLELMSVLLPVFLIGLVAWGGSAGTSALQARAEDVLLRLLPTTLAHVTEAPAPFHRAWQDAAGGPRLLPGRARDRLRGREAGQLARVLVNLRRDECHTDMVLLLPGRTAEAPWTELVIRVEINVRKVNLNLCFERALVRERLGLPEDAPDAQVAAALRDALGHAIGGAAAEGDGAEAEAKPARERLCYVFNRRPIEREVAGEPYVCLVASAWLADDFLWDAGDRLFFAQDLMFFLRAVIAEADGLLRLVPAAEVPAREARLMRAAA